jgi:Na+-driven multidrug efflux pump
MASFVAQNVGAGKEKRAKQAMVTGMVIGCVFGVIITLFVFWRGDLLASVFSSDQTVILKAAEYLRGFSPEAIVTCILFSFIGYYNGHGETLFVMLQGMAQTFLVRLPMSYLMSIQPNASLTKIGIAAPSATVFGILINVVFFIYYTRKLEANRKNRDNG